MSESARFDDLKRRVQKDPASPLFAQLAEEHRRAGDYAEAIRVCRNGLRHYPDYHSARVTLGRALLAYGDLDTAARELETVLRTDPGNLLASRALQEVHEAQGPARADATAGDATEPEPPAPGPSAAAMAGLARVRAKAAARVRLCSHLERWLEVVRADRERRHQVRPRAKR